MKNKSWIATNTVGMDTEGENSRLVQVDIPGLKAWNLGKILKDGRKMWYFFVRLLVAGLLYKRKLDKVPGCW